LIVTDSRRDPDDPRKNRRYSAWRVLVNTNVSRKSINRDHYHAIVHRLNEMWETVFGPTPSNMNEFQDLSDPIRFPMFSVPDNPYLRWKVVSNPNFPPPKASSRKKGEIGKKFGKIHLHGEFRILHYGHVRLDYNALKQTMKSLLVGAGGELGITNPYITFEYVVDREGDELYLEKGGEDHRDQTDRELGPIADIDAEEAEAIRRAASNESSNSRRRIVQDSDNDDDDLVHPPTPPEPEPEEQPPPPYTGPHARRRLRPRPGQQQGPEYGGEVMPRSEFRSRNRRRRGKK
jgi:hypothetical protein